MGAIAIVPAAGRAERFGGGKLIAEVDGQPLLDHTLRSLLDGGIERVIVVMAPGAAFPTVTLLNDPRVSLTVNPDPARGMFSSIQQGLGAAEGEPILVLPADMPFVKCETVAAVLSAARDSRTIVSPCFNGRHGHPVALPGRLRDAVLSAPPGMTLSELIETHATGRVEVNVDDPGIRRDVDVRGDLRG